MSIKLAAGEQVDIVCAKIDKDETEAGSDNMLGDPVGEDDTVTNVFEMKKMVDQMSNLSQYSSAVLYGSMKEKDKLETMERFLAGDIKILISTTVIEVGVDVPNATTIVIFDADRFGLSTLHQLRGRVGRGTSASKCILISDSDTPRLKIMEKTDDGFEISEEDFKLRGHGDLFGTKQSGDMAFKIASIKSDYKILLQAKKDSKEYLLNKDNDDDELKKRLISSITEG